MSDVVLLGTVISFLISIIGYFLHRLVSGIDAGLSSLKEEVYRDSRIVTGHIDRFKAELLVLNTSITTSGISITYIQKKMDDLQKTQDLVAQISNRLVATETKLDNIGKVIYVEKK
jgi:hypothetical protein